MYVTYKPEDGSEQTWTFKAGRVRQSEAEMIEARAGCDYDQWVDGVRKANARARRVLLWHLTRRTHPMLRYEDVPDFYMDELEVAYDASEIREFIDRVDDPEMPVSEQEREALRTALVRELVQAEEREEGKAPSKASDVSTASPSPITSESAPGSSATS